jgi:hypothetical protein
VGKKEIHMASRKKISKKIEIRNSFVDTSTPMAYNKNAESCWITIVETKSFSARAEKCMSHREVFEAIEMIAKNPRIGNIIEGTGGLRKVRFGTGGKGKRGGVRISYYYFNNATPVFLLTVFSKNEKDNLTRKERNQLAKSVQLIKHGYYH